MQRPTWILINYKNSKDIHRLVLRYGRYASFVIVDNSQDYVRTGDETVCIPDRNLGYIGGFQFALKFLNCSEKKVIISNSDIELKKSLDIFILPDGKAPRFVAPLILNLNGISQNPHLCDRPSRRFYLVRKFFSSKSILWLLWTIGRALRFHYFRRATRFDDTIYAGHGSFIILENIDLSIFLEESYNFLFGEEIHFAEIARKFSIPFVLDRGIEIKHFEHVSTSSLSEKNKVSLYHESYEFILNNYYR